MANELHAYTDPSLTLYAVLLSSTGAIWNGTGFVAINGANWTQYDIAMTEATAGLYLATMPTAAAGEYSYVTYQRAGVAPAITDTIRGTGWISWDGTAEVALTENGIADAILKRDWSSVTGEAARSVLNALRFLRNKWSITGTVLTVTKENDSTTAWTADLVATAGADPVTSVDPS